MIDAELVNSVGLKLKKANDLGVFGILLEFENDVIINIQAGDTGLIFDSHCIFPGGFNGIYSIRNRDDLLKDMTIFLDKCSYTIDDSVTDVVRVHITFPDGNTGIVDHVLSHYHVMLSTGCNPSRIYILDNTDVGILLNITLYDYISEVLDDNSVHNYFKKKREVSNGLKELLLAYIRNRKIYLGKDLKAIISLFEKRYDDLINQNHLGVTAINELCVKGIVTTISGIPYSLYNTLGFVL